jgi:hypothetical protein
MKGNIILSFLLIGLLTLWGVLSQGFQHNPLDNFYPFILENKTLKQNLADGSINIVYPVTKSSILNEAITSFIGKEKKDFIENIKGLKAISSAIGSLDITYASYLSDRTISIKFDVNTDTGGAHGNFTTITFNYDRVSNRVLKIQDIFIDQANYLNSLANLSKPLLGVELTKVQFQDDTWLEEGAGPKEENYRRFIFSPEGITFFFDPYQVAPYTAGPQEITLTYQELSPLLFPEY